VTLNLICFPKKNKIMGQQLWIDDSIIVVDDMWVTSVGSEEERIREFAPKLQYTHEGEKAPFSAIGLNRDTELLWLGNPAVSVACINWGKSKNWQKESPHSQNNATTLSTHLTLLFFKPFFHLSISTPKTEICYWDG